VENVPTPRLPLSFWFARHPGVVDVVQTLFSVGLALPFLVTTVMRVPEPGRTRALVPLLVLLTLAGTLPLLWRRTATQTVLIVTTLAAVLVTVLAPDHNQATPIGPYFALYTLAAYRPRRRSILGLGFTWVMLGGVALLGSLSTPRDALATTLATLALVFGAWAYGRSVGLRRAYMAELEARAEHLQRGREADMRAVLAEERARIARELHDVVAHHVSVMTVQASAAQRMLDRDVARSREAMAAVELTGRGALTEMRRLVGVLRGPEEAGPTADAAGQKAPQPGLTDIESLVTSVREAGLDVSVKVEGEPSPLSSGMDLAVYRIVQEALTNTLKHAGAARSRVLLRYDAAELMVRVVDDGRGLTPPRVVNGRTAGPGEPGAALGGAVNGMAPEAPPRPGRTGHGLLGMRERVSLYGGRLYTGPRADGGYEVLARIPLEPRT
jgi:signal transduction histidine kinase